MEAGGAAEDSLPSPIHPWHMGDMETQGEQEAVQRWRRGDPEGLAWLVRCYQHSALQVAALILMDPVEAEDAVQEAFLRAWIYRDRFRSSMPFWPWFRRLVIHEALRRARHKAYEHSVEAGLVADLEEKHAIHTEDPSAQVEQEEELSRLAWALRALSPRQRAILVLYYYEGMGVKAIAQILGCAAGTIQWQLHDARKRLRDLLQGE